MIFFCLLFVFFNTVLYSQQIIHLDSKEGLINGTINAFERDSLGYMWIGTDQGINRYSGVEFKNYDLDDNNKIKGKEIIDLLGLSDRLNHKPNELSGGEQQRVAVARALINNPAIILADEPSGNLDSTTAKELHQLFFDLRDKLQQTFVIVTHNEDLAKMADRTLVMKDGLIV